MRRSNYILFAIVCFLTIIKEAYTMDLPEKGSNIEGRATARARPSTELSLGENNPPLQPLKKATKKKKKNKFDTTPLDIFSIPGKKDKAYESVYSGNPWIPFPGEFERAGQKAYEAFVRDNLKFYTLGRDRSKVEKVYTLLAWSQLTNVPILALSQDETFFRRNLHIMGPNDYSLLENTLNSYTFSVIYTKDKFILKGEKKDSKEEILEFSKEVTPSIKANVLLYHPDENMAFFNDPTKDEVVKGDNITRYVQRTKEGPISPQICFDFLNNYLANLCDFSEDYLDQVIIGLRSLPKRIVNTMKGKAIYLSEKYGSSMTIHTASNMRRIEYLGLIPGVFLENLKGGIHILHQQLDHEVGHLIHQTVINPSFIVKVGGRDLPSMPIFPIFPEFCSFAKELDALFTGCSKDYAKDAHKDTYQQNLDKRGFITYYSQKNMAEDFAETFKYYIIHNKYFSDIMRSRKIELRPDCKIKTKDAPDGTLAQKYHFIQKIVGIESIKLGENLLDVKEYKFKD